MDSILTTLFKGNIRPLDNLTPTDPEFPALKEQLNKDTAYFKSVLSAEDYERLNKYEEASDTISEMENAESFTRGFQLAVKIMVEVYRDKNDLPDIILEMLGIDKPDK